MEIKFKDVSSVSGTHRISEGAFPGYSIYHLEECEALLPHAAAEVAYGNLWYGILRPDLILSSEIEMKRMVGRIIDGGGEVIPRMYGNFFGFLFNGATWSYAESIDDNWVFLLNTKNPVQYRLNGCFRIKGDL